MLVLVCDAFSAPALRLLAIVLCDGVSSIFSSVSSEIKLNALKKEKIIPTLRIEEKRPMSKNVA